MVLIACLLILLWLLASYFESQRALKWWHHRQSMQFCDEAERIRDGLLQDSFVLRRTLEVLLATQGAHNLEQLELEWLANIEQLHQSLTELSDRLSPPYIQDSLPLALKSMLDSWRSQAPGSNLLISLPNDWRTESYEQSQVILTALRELLQIVQSAPEQPASTAINLSLQGKLGELKVQFSDLTPATLIAGDRATNCRYLNRAFQVLTNGECFYRHADRTLTWYFRWRSSRSGPLAEAGSQSNA